MRGRLILWLILLALGLVTRAGAQTTQVTNTAPEDAVPVRCVNVAGTTFESCGGTGGGGGTVTQGPNNASTLTSAAWSVRLIFGDVVIDPRLVTAAQGAAAATSDVNAWPIKVIFENAHIDPRLVRVHDGVGNSIPSATTTPGLTDRGLEVRAISASREASIVLDALNEELALDITGYRTGGALVTDFPGCVCAFTFYMSADGTTWIQAPIFHQGDFGLSERIIGSTPTVSTGSVITVLPISPIRSIKVKMDAYTSGSVSFLLRATDTESGMSQLAFYPQDTPSAQMLPNIAVQIGGLNQSTSTFTHVNTRAAAPTAADVGLVVRPFMGTNGAQNMPTMDAAARRGFVQLTDGTSNQSFTGTSANVNCTGGCGSAPASNHISVGFSESVAAPFANTWYVKRRWTPPASSVFIPTRIASFVTTAASRNYVGTGRVLGTWNENTNAFTDGASLVAPRHFNRLFAIVTTNRAATANTITVTYTDENGTAGNAATCTMPATALTVGSAIECILAVTSGQERDAGVRDITAIADSAAPATGIVEVWGMSTLHENHSVANAYEQSASDIAEVPTTDSLLIMLMQVAATAQQRGVMVTGSIR